MEIEVNGISSQIFGLISSFLNNRRLQVVLVGSLHKNIQLMLKFLKALFFLYYTLVTFLMMLSVILLTMLMILLTTLNMIRQQLEFASKLEFNLQDIVDWGRKFAD